MKAINELLENIEQGTDFILGTPWRYSDKSMGVVVPILVKEHVSKTVRSYITLEEAKEKGIEVKDTGKIDRVVIESSLDSPVFIRAGTILKSNTTQSRAVETSILIIKKEEDKKHKMEVPVRCVYASKGISGGTKFAYGGTVPLEVREALLSKKGQASTWYAVAKETNYRTQAMRSTPGFERHMQSSQVRSDNLSGVMEEIDKFTPNLDKILNKVPLFKEQVGAVFMDMKDVVGLEMFDHPKSWEAIHKDVEKRLGESVAKEDQSFFKPDYDKVKPMIYGFMKKLIDGEKTEIKGKGDSSTVIIRGDGVIGEATMIGDKVIHLVGIKSQPESKKESTVGAASMFEDRLGYVGRTPTRGESILRPYGIKTGSRV